MAGEIPLDPRAGRRASRQGRASTRRSCARSAIPSGPPTFTGAWRRSARTRSQQALRTSGGSRQHERPHRRARHPPEQRRSSSSAPRRAASGCTTRRPGTWSPKTSDQETQAIGALAIAPSNDAIIYAGTGEGALSGDSYFGNGVLKSTDGGNTWTHVSGDVLPRRRESRIVVDPTNADHVYAAVAARPWRRPPHVARRTTRSSASGSRRTAASTGS